jgi:transposase
VIVVGVDPHKDSHSAAAVERRTAELLDEQTVPARRPGFAELLAWARTLDDERLWALEDGRHVSGGLERFLLAAGERVVRVSPKLMAKERKTARQFGKSDAIDALAVARAAVREPDLPAARPPGPEREIALLSNHRDALVEDATRIARRLRWLLHDLDPALEPPGRSLSNPVVIERLSRRLRALPQSTQVRVCREQLCALRALVRRAAELRRELAVLVRRQAAPLLELPGCGVLTAARIVAEVDHVGRFRSEAKLATYAGVAPLDASSGRQQRHRLNRTGNRQLNCAFHRIAVSQGRCHPPASAYLARKQAEGKSRREALRCLKRHITRTVFHTLRTIEAPADTPTSRPTSPPT